jgi:hypothetical protein
LNRAIREAGPQAFFGFVDGLAGVADNHNRRQAVGDVAFDIDEQGGRAGLINDASDRLNHTGQYATSPIKRKLLEFYIEEKRPGALFLLRVLEVVFRFCERFCLLKTFWMEQRLARSRCFEVFLFLSTLFIQVLVTSYKYPKNVSIRFLCFFQQTCV